MKCNENGLALIRKFEGLRLTAYRCPAGVLTIGYGHTGPEVRENQIITPDGANQLLCIDLQRFERAIEQVVKGAATTSNQFSALCCLAYNIGANALIGSTLLRYHLAGKKGEAGNEFLRWNKAGGQVLNGLTRRRDAERCLYLTPDEGIHR